MSAPLTLQTLRSLSLAALLSLACATSSPATHEWPEVVQTDASSCEAPSEDACIVFACDGEECGVFGCEDVNPEAVTGVTSGHEVELARGFRPPFHVHDWTMIIPEHIHLRIHSGQGRGGLWNEAWRQFRLANEGRRLTKEAFFAKAFELAYRYDIAGPITSYRQPIVPPGPQLLAP